jgi:hypothetical protein
MVENNVHARCSELRKMIVITPQHARGLAIARQFPNHLPKGKEGVAEIIENLGYIQIDTISVIERAHHHTLWNRLSGYRHKMLHDLQAQDRRIFEYWGHAMSFLPMRDYRFFIPLIESFAQPESKWYKYKYDKCRDYLKPVLERIEAEGALSSKDFERGEGEKRGPWWDWKPAKTALEVLYWQGKLMVSERRNFQKYYDLTERVLPADLDTTRPTENELGRFLVRRAMKSYGIATEAEVRDHLRAAAGRIVTKALRTMAKEGEIVPVGIKGVDGTYYAMSTIEDDLARLRAVPKRVRFLSPFDNLVIQRSRMAKLWQFDYTLECYVPQPKRKFGYFTLPLLYGTNLVGRADMVAQRAERCLQINRIELEPEVRPSEAFCNALAAAMRKFMQFNDCEVVKVLLSEPDSLATMLQAISLGRRHAAPPRMVI